MALFSEEGVRFFRRLGKISLVVLTVVAAGTGVFWRVVVHREKAAEAAWAALDFPETRPGVRFSRSLTNATAVALQVRLTPLGLSPIPLKTMEEIERRSPWADILTTVHAYLEEQVETPTPAVSSPARPLAVFLEQHRADLDAVRALLLSDLPPRWAADPEDPARGQEIHNLALAGLGEWLLADALESRLSGDPGRADRDLAAAWVLVELLLERPDVNAQASALSLTRGLAGVLRKMEGASPEVWGERLRPQRFRTGLEASIVLVGRGYLQVARATARQPYYGRQARRERMLWKIYGRLWYRHSMADASLKIARQLEALRALGECAGNYRTQTRTLAGSGTRFGATGRIGMADYGIPWTSLMQLRTEMELTRKILALRALRGADGCWPQAPEGFGGAECPKARWGYARREDGSADFWLEGGVPPPRRSGILDLPPTYHAPGPMPADGPRP